MHFHLPKPLHGWREFIGEVGIIVIGVLIALGAEQVVESIHDRKKLNENRNALAVEVGANTDGAVIRMRMTECVDNRLDQLGAWLDRASAAHRLPPLGPFGRVRQVPTSSATWTSFLATPLATTLAPSKLNALRIAYNYSELLKASQQQELGAWNTLWTMVGPGRELSPVEEPQLRQAIITARSANIQIGYVAADYVEAVRDVDLPFTAAQRQQLSHVLHEPLKKVDVTGLCTPNVQKAPTHYGLSPSAYFLSMPRDVLRAGVQLGAAKPSN